MEEKKKDAKPKAATKVEAKPTVKAPAMLVDWVALGQEVEKALKEANWNRQKQARNPRFVFSLVSKHIIGPLIRAIQTK